MLPMYSMSSQVKESDCRKCSADTRMAADTLGGDGTRHQGWPLAPAIRACRFRCSDERYVPCQQQRELGALRCQ